jgi:hypothetical protein
MFLIVDMNRRPAGESVADWVGKILHQAAEIAASEATRAEGQRGGVPGESLFYGGATFFAAPEVPGQNPHVAAYKRGYADGMRELEDLVATLLELEEKPAP